MKYNYNKYDFKISLIRNKELKECLNLLKTKNKVCVYGYQGVGKKTFVQKVGFYNFERNMFDNIYYLELYSIKDESKKILKLKTEEIMNEGWPDKDDENKPEFYFQKILIIVYINCIIEDADLKILQQIINSSNDNFNFLYAFTISDEIKNKKDKKIIRCASIELKKLDKQKGEKLVDKFLNYKKKKKQKTTKNSIYLKIF